MRPYNSSAAMHVVIRNHLQRWLCQIRKPTIWSDSSINLLFPGVITVGQGFDIRHHGTAKMLEFKQSHSTRRYVDKSHGFPQPHRPTALEKRGGI